MPLESINGKEKVELGIVFIFKGAIKDQVFPKNLYFSTEEASVHTEDRTNWGIY